VKSAINPRAIVVLPEPLEGAAIIKLAFIGARVGFVTAKIKKNNQKWMIIQKSCIFAVEIGNQATDVALMQGNPVKVRNSTCCCNPHYGGLLV
jgi:hypothetical protein